MSRGKFGTLLQGIAAHPWASLRDFIVLSCVMVFAVLLAQQYDIFAFISALAEPRRQISPAEAMLLGCIGASCVWIFISRRLTDARRGAAVDADDLAWQLRELRELAMQDPLTGLPNRRVLTTSLEAAMGAPPGAGRSHALFLLDLNGFKRVNDRFGHAVGDQVLQAVVERFRRVTRSNDLLARLGGDEFAVLACNVDEDAAQSIGKRFIEALSNEVRSDEDVHSIGVAIGASLFPVDGNTPEKLLRHADVAMYRAKMSAGSALVFFDSIVAQLPAENRALA